MFVYYLWLSYLHPSAMFIFNSDDLQAPHRFYTDQFHEIVLAQCVQLLNGSARIANNSSPQSFSHWFACATAAINTCVCICAKSDWFLPTARAATGCLAHNRGQEPGVTRSAALFLSAVGGSPSTCAAVQISSSEASRSAKCFLLCHVAS
jgi:hypothetical protein